MDSQLGLKCNNIIIKPHNRKLSYGIMYYQTTCTYTSEYVLRHKAVAVLSVHSCL